jgi:hypothetical protein
MQTVYPIAMFPALFHRFQVMICKHFGHRWRYKDFSNYMKSNGDKFDFLASRKCIRCYQHAYYYAEWENEERSELDVESDFYLSNMPVKKVLFP